MPSLKHLKNRIHSIKSTCKITNAMKVVSGAKLKKARTALDENKPYSQEITELAEALLKQMPDKQDYPLLCSRSDSKYCLLLVIGSEKGLCGSFNSGLAKTVKQKIADLTAEGQVVKVMCVGAKIHGILKHSAKVQVDLSYNNAKLLIKNVEEFVQSLIDKFLAGQFDSCIVCYNNFCSTINRDVLVRQFIPLYISDENAVSCEVSLECEPSVEMIAQELISYVMIGNILSILFESSASEEAARMTAMDNATRNASKIIKTLTTLYNRQRQANVTTELIEIISGAESIGAA